MKRASGTGIEALDVLPVTRDSNRNVAAGTYQASPCPMQLDDARRKLATVHGSAKIACDVSLLHFFTLVV